MVGTRVTIRAGLSSSEMLGVPFWVVNLGEVRPD